MRLVCRAEEQPDAGQGAEHYKSLRKGKSIFQQGVCKAGTNMHSPYKQASTAGIFQQIQAKGRGKAPKLWII